MARLSIGREVRKGRIHVDKSVLGVTLHRRTGRGTWVNHFTNEVTFPKVPPTEKGLRNPHYAKVKTIHA